MTLITHVGHAQERDTFTVQEIQHKTNNSVSQAQIRRSLAALEQMGLVEHSENAKTYYFKG